MKPFAALVFLLVFSARGQEPKIEIDISRGGPSLKQKQIEELLKKDHEKSIEEAAQLVDLATALKLELESSNKYQLSLAAIKKSEEIEKLAKRIRGRMKRF
jgi:hypothetical protein